MYHSFTEMPVWQNALKIAVEIFHLTIGLPRSEDYGLTSQIRRSSNSVPGNISEGFGRRTKKDKSNFYTIARASAFETQNHLLYGNKVGYFNDEKTKQYFNEYTSLIHELNKLIKSLD
jgi:four helix bundle protein